MSYFEDPTERSEWRPLRLLLDDMDADIARLYAEAGIDGVKPTYVQAMIKLHAHGPMTLTQLAELLGRTHSAVSQKVAAMRVAGLVRTEPGRDARSKTVMLTDTASRLVGRLAAEWRATEDAVAELEGELPYPLMRVVGDIREALGRRSFHDRILTRLVRDPQWR